MPFVKQSGCRLNASRTPTVAARTVAVLSLWLISPGAATVSFAETPSPDAAICARMGEAMQKTAKTPYTSISIIKLDPSQANSATKTASSRTSETIFTGNSIFVRSGGERWRKIDAEVGSLQELVRKASSRLGHCQDLGGGEVKGIQVAILSAEDASKNHSTTTRLWIDKARGILVKSESEAKTQDGSRHSVIEYKYENVAAPQL